MASAYKWRITNYRYAYLLGADSNHNYNSDNICDYCFISDGIVDEDVISLKVKQLDEASYKAKYEELCEFLSQDEDGKKLNMLSYSYFYNVDDSSCNVIKYTDTIKGNTGDKGVGIDKISYAYDTDSNTTVVTIHLTDNTTYPIVIKNGKDGKDGSDGKNGETGSTETTINYVLSAQDAIMEGIYSDILDDVQTKLDSTASELEKKLKDVSTALEGINGSLSAYTKTTDSNGSYNELYEYYNSLSGYTAQLQKQYYALSGKLSTEIDYVSALSGKVNEYTETVNAMDGAYYQQLSSWDSINQQLNQWNQDYNSLKNEFDNTVSSLTKEVDEKGNETEVVSLSQIKQTTNSLTAIVENSMGVAAGIMMVINDDESEISIKADKIYLLGETCARYINTIDLVINDGKSKFNADGSGYVANGLISWNSKGAGTIGKGISGITWTSDGKIVFGSAVDVQVDGDFSAQDITLGNGTSYFDHTGYGWVANKNIYWNADGSGRLGDNAVVWNSDGGGNIANGNITWGNDGSGSIANGAIYWDSTKKIRFSNNVVLSSDQLTIDADMIIGTLNENDALINGGSSKFCKDGSGYLANGNITWDSSGNMEVMGAFSQNIQYAYKCDATVVSNVGSSLENKVTLKLNKHLYIASNVYDPSDYSSIDNWQYSLDAKNYYTICLPQDPSYIGKEVKIYDCNFGPFTRQPYGWVTTTIKAENDCSFITKKTYTGSDTYEVNKWKSITFRGGYASFICVPYLLDTTECIWLCTDFYGCLCTGVDALGNEHADL